MCPYRPQTLGLILFVKNAKINIEFFITKPLIIVRLFFFSSIKFCHDKMKNMLAQERRVTDILPVYHQVQDQREGGSSQKFLIIFNIRYIVCLFMYLTWTKWIIIR